MPRYYPRTHSLPSYYPRIYLPLRYLRARSDGGAPVIVSIVGVFVLICALSLLRFLFTTASVRFKRVGVAARIITSALVRVGPSKLKLAITFYQVTAAIPKTFDIDPLPADFSQVLSFFTWVEFDLAEITYPTGCL